MMYKLNNREQASYLSTLFLALFFVLFPWEEVFNVSFFDIPFYLVRIDGLLRGDEAYLSYTFAQWVSSEPLWGKMLLLIGSTFDQPMTGLLIVSFCCIAVFSTLTFSRFNIALGTFFLLNPLVVDLIMSQVRSALSVSILLIAFNTKRRVLVIALVGTAVLIHTIGFVLVTTYVFCHFAVRLEKKFGYRLAALATLAYATLIAMALSIGRAAILEGSGDRRIEYGTDTNSVAYLIFWFALGIALMLTKRDQEAQKTWSDHYAIVVLTLPFLMMALGANGIRFVALGFPLILHALGNRTERIRNILLGALFSYQLVQYYYWFSYS
ncbi:hypothetical protein GTP44_13385 [Duganella sp. FT50W]|uniref:EpsG family protein n=1 Tax=Duganella lactea TaxID=2692173 RepID=A0A6L8MM89_9BURK|nr:hypothetical protein [Duganella lactea]MYM82946.1 hypothetical protein [Duganella lactea]